MYVNQRGHRMNGPELGNHSNEMVLYGQKTTNSEERILGSVCALSRAQCKIPAEFLTRL